MTALNRWIQRRIAARSPRGRARAFASRYFAGCQTHAREAAFVHRALERLSQKPTREIRPDTPIADVVTTSESSTLRGLDLLEVTELVMAMEAELGVSSSAATRTLSHETWRVVMARLLLGPAFERTAWEPETIWARSVREVIDERVRWAGGCTCLEETRPTTS